MTRSLHFKFYIAPYEQFISGWQSQESSQMTRSLHLKLEWQFLYCAV